MSGDDFTGIPFHKTVPRKVSKMEIVNEPGAVCKRICQAQAMRIDCAYDPCKDYDHDVNLRPFSGQETYKP